MAPPNAPREVADGVYVLDSGMFGQLKFGGVYFVAGREPALVESGTSGTAEAVLRGLRALRVLPSEVRQILVTHIHLDHAGGAGFLLDHMPRARVVVHERGMRHLADPTRLLESASKALGPWAPSYGTLKPIPPERMMGVTGGEVLPLGDREVETIYTPGHARHHICYFDRTTEAVFTGDAAGILFPDDRRIIPTTPFPEFDLPTALGAMDTLIARRPSLLLFTHFGPQTEVGPTLRSMQEEYRWWDQRLKGERREVESLGRAIYEERYSSVNGFPREFVERTIQTNIRGFRAYYDRTAGGP